jgi:hypothetical protein
MFFQRSDGSARAGQSFGIRVEALTRIFDALEQGGMNVTRNSEGLALGWRFKTFVEPWKFKAAHAEIAGPGQRSTFIVELPNEAAGTASKEP